MRYVGLKGLKSIKDIKSFEDFKKALFKRDSSTFSQGGSITSPLETWSLFVAIIVTTQLSENQYFYINKLDILSRVWAIAFIGSTTFLFYHLVKHLIDKDADHKPGREFFFLLVQIYAFIGSFAFLYSVSGGVSDIEKGDNWAYLYFSVVTWTTLGYGDLSPEGWVRYVAAFEAMFGYLVNAVVIGVIIDRLQVGRNAKLDDAAKEIKMVREEAKIALKKEVVARKQKEAMQAIMHKNLQNYMNAESEAPGTISEKTKAELKETLEAMIREHEETNWDNEA